MRCAGRTRRIMLALCALTCAAAAVLASCGKKEDGDSIGADTSSAECDSMNGINESDADSSRVYNAAAINRLTGLPLDDTSLHNHRPIAIMINNINVACPQEGISKAEVMYECTVEGGITRMMMLVNDYESLPTVGSVRSCRFRYLRDIYSLRLSARRPRTASSRVPFCALLCVFRERYSQFS